jgi:eukaryotic-like serine/threonine-protein kinase
LANSKLPDFRQMTPERWQVLQEIFGRVSELPAAQREIALRDSCPDAEVESEVRRLLTQLEEAGTFLDRPAVAAMALREGWDEDSPRFLPGACVADRFEIVRLLGRGGMGEVYEAYDRSSCQHVALKTLRVSLISDRKAVTRFRLELLRARNVTHENVCRIHEIFSVQDHDDQPLVFLTMELLVGPTLYEILRRPERLSSEEALRYAGQIASGLEAAHRKGVVHRDIKPGNVIVTGRGAEARAVITDFGLALQTTMNAETISVSRTLVGTPAYMAPEQLRGELVSSSADVYSFGVIVSEMLLGRRPEALSPPANPQERVWMEAVRQCTAGDRTLRFESPSAFVAALGARPPSKITRRLLLGGTAAAAAAVGAGLWNSRRGKGLVTLAVLPVDGGGDANGYVEAAATDLLIERLRQFQEFQVPGPSAIRRLKGKSLPARDVARSLSVDWLLSCNLSYVEKRIRVHARLIRGDGSPGPWEKRFEGGVEQLNEMTASIASEVAGALRPALAQAGGLGETFTTNPQAYDLYLRARYLWNRRQRDDLAEARRLLERSVALDSRFAMGYCGLADTLSVLGDYGQAPPIEVLPLAKQAALTALSLNSNVADCHVSFAFATALNDFDWFNSERSYLRAIELNPNHGLAHQWYSGLLARMLRTESAIQHAKEAIRQDSLSIPANRNLAVMLYLLRKYPEAIEQATRVQAMAPGFFGCRELLAESYARRGEKEAALQLIREIEADLRTPGFALAHAADVYAILGMADRALETIARLTSPASNLNYQPVHVARAYSDLGRADECFHWLEIAYTKRDTGLQILPVHESFDHVRRDSRFPQFIDRLRIIYPTTA